MNDEQLNEVAIAYMANADIMAVDQARLAGLRPLMRAVLEAAKKCGWSVEPPTSTDKRAGG